MPIRTTCDCVYQHVCPQVHKKPQDNAALAIQVWVWPCLNFKCTLHSLHLGLIDLLTSVDSVGSVRNIVTAYTKN